MLAYKRPYFLALVSTIIHILAYGKLYYLGHLLLNLEISFTYPIISKLPKEDNHRWFSRYYILYNIYCLYHEICANYMITWTRSRKNGNKPRFWHFSVIVNLLSQGRNDENKTGTTVSTNVKSRILRNQNQIILFNVVYRLVQSRGSEMITNIHPPKYQKDNGGC